MEVRHIRVIGAGIPGMTDIIDVTSGEKITDVLKMTITYDPKVRALIAVLEHAVMLRGDIDLTPFPEYVLVDEIHYTREIPEE